MLDGNGSGQLSDFSGYTGVSVRVGLHITIMLSSASCFLTSEIALVSLLLRKLNVDAEELLEESDILLAPLTSGSSAVCGNETLIVPFSLKKAEA